MSDYDLAALAAAPLADPNKINLPAGRRTAPRGRTAEYYCEAMPQLSGRELRERKAKDRDRKLGSLLTYYAGTDIPFERVAEHTGLSLEVVTRAMADRGRAS